MNKQHNDQDDKQVPGEAERSGTSPASGTKANRGADSKKGGSGRRSRRYSKTDSVSQSAGKDADTSAATASTTAADASVSDASSSSNEASTGSTDSGSVADSKAGKAASASATTSSKASASKTARSESAAAKNTPEKSTPAKSGNKTSGSVTGSSAGGSGSGSGGGSQHAGSKDGGSKTGAVALVLTLALGAAGGYFGWQMWHKLEAQDKAVASLPQAPVSQDDLDALKSELQSQLKNGEQQRNQTLQSSLDTLRSEFGDYRASVNGTLDKVLTQLSQEQDTDERDWLHAEAAYLLRLANQRLQLERDVGGAAALLQTADKRLEEADNPALTPVRREIASELAELKSVPRVDSTGLYLELNALQEQASSLPLNQDIEEIVADARIEETPTGGWQSQLSTFGNELKGLVTVRKHDEALEALISPEQESYLRQSLRLILEQSQLALLKQEQELYDASLGKALTLLNGYYDTDNAGVNALIDNIEQLRKAQIHPDLPDISGSQQALGRFIQQRFEGGSRQGDNA